MSPRPGTCRRVPLHSRSRPEAPTDRASLRLLQGARRSGLNEVQADSRTDACSSRCRRHVGPWRVRVTETEPFTVHRSPCIVSHRHCSIEPRSCPLHSTKHNGTAALSSHCSLVWTGPSATAPPSQISTVHHSAQINWRPCPRHRQITESADSSVNIQTLSIDNRESQRLRSGPRCVARTPGTDLQTRSVYPITAFAFRALLVQLVG